MKTEHDETREKEKDRLLQKQIERQINQLKKEEEMLFGNSSMCLIYYHKLKVHSTLSLFEKNAKFCLIFKSEKIKKRIVTL